MRRKLQCRTFLIFLGCAAFGILRTFSIVADGLPRNIVSEMEAPVQVTRKTITKIAKPITNLTSMWNQFYRQINVEESIENLFDVARNLGDLHGYVFITFINKEFLKLTKNWLCNTAKMDGVHNRTIIVAVDQEVKDSLVTVWPNLLVQVVARPVTEITVGGLSDKLFWGTSNYVAFLTFRTHIMSELTTRNVSYVLFETDAIWLKNPVTYFDKLYTDVENDLTLPLKGYPDRHLTLSFNPLMVKPTDANKDFFKELSRQLESDSTSYDQDVLDRMCKVQYKGTHCRTMPWTDIADGKWFQLTRFSKQTFTPYIINNNFITGTSTKITRQALHGMWFLEPDGSCNSGAQSYNR